MPIGFCVVYRWKLVRGKERKFQDAWETLTREIRAHAGGLGSRLHRAADGTWLAYAQWPDRATWERADVSTAAAKAAMQATAEAVAERMEPILLDPVADLLVPADDA